MWFFILIKYVFGDTHFDFLFETWPFYKKVVYFVFFCKVWYISLLGMFSHIFSACWMMSLPNVSYGSPLCVSSPKFLGYLYSLRLEWLLILFTTDFVFDGKEREVLPFLFLCTDRFITRPTCFDPYITPCGETFRSTVMDDFKLYTRYWFVKMVLFIKGFFVNVVFGTCSYKWLRKKNSTTLDYRELPLYFYLISYKYKTKEVTTRGSVAL